jgi:hypothetical protein
VLLFYPLGNRPDLGQAVTPEQASHLAQYQATEARKAAAEACMAAEQRGINAAQQKASKARAQHSSQCMAAMARRRQQFRDEQEQYWSEKKHKEQQQARKDSKPAGKKQCPPPADKPDPAAAAAAAAIKSQLKRARNIPSFANYVSVFVVRVGSGQRPQGMQQVFEDGANFAAVHGYHWLTLVNRRDPEASVTLAHDTSHPGGALRIRCIDGPPDYDNMLTRWGARKFMKVSIW